MFKFFLRSLYESLLSFTKSWDEIMMIMLLTSYDWMYKENSKITCLRLTRLRTSKSKLMRIFFRKLSEGLFDNYDIVPKEKKFRRSISK